MATVDVSKAVSAGVGYSVKTNDRDAGAEAVSTALAGAGIDSCDLVLLFSSTKQDPTAVYEGARSVAGARPKIVGGATVGVITNDWIGWEAHQVGAAVLKGDLGIQVFHERGISDREHDAGVALGRRIRAAYPHGQPSGMYLLYDIVHTGIGGAVTRPTPLLAGMTESMRAWPTTAGGALMGDLMFTRSFQWVGDEMLMKSAFALTIGGRLRMDTILIHGCKPAGRYYTITKAEGTMVLELDGQRATDVIGRLLGTPDWKDFPLFITLGMNKGDKFGEYREEDWVVRMGAAVDEARGGVAFFGDDLRAGTEVQLMRRSIVASHMAGRVDELKSRVSGRRPVLATYVDCAGRSSAMCGSDGEEATEIQKAIGDIPLLGWYVGGEIARTHDVMQSHNWTGVLSILSEDIRG